jgi:oligopeptide transport system ATP-binding protein
MRSIPMSTEPGAAALLHVRGLAVSYASAQGAVAALRGVDLDLRAHECLGIVGESGCGKTQLLHALMGLQPAAARLQGSVRFRDQELLGASARALASLRGRRLALVFQDPMSALNPYLRIGTQLAEGARSQLGLSRRAAWQRATALLESMQIDAAARCLRQYPHQLSGGMRQRVMIAMALMCDPEVLLLDEPTTALDVTVQAQVLALLREVRRRSGVAMIFVTHDLGVLAAIADRVAVMYGGRIVELAPVAQLYATPRHPYTAGLLHSMPRLDTPLGERLPVIPGQPPHAGADAAGCAFAPRCALAHERCSMVPPLRKVPIAAAGDAWVACHFDGAPQRLRGIWT